MAMVKYDNKFETKQKIRFEKRIKLIHILQGNMY